MSKPILVRYERQDHLVRLRLIGLTNHELRAVLVGLWGRLDREDQEDHIRELQHYLDAGSRMSPVSRAIASGERDGHVIDVAKLVEQEMREGGES